MIAVVHLVFANEEGALVRQDGNHEGGDIYSYEEQTGLRAAFALVYPQEPGYWAAYAPNFRRNDTIFCSRIAQTGYSWWHGMLGHKVGDPARGANIRIGVIDAGFTPDRSLAHIQMIETAGDIVDDVGDYWIHGEVISRIISDRDAPACCAPIAPGAELFFASATYNGSMAGSPAFRFPISGSPGSSHLDPTLIADAIFEMALNHDVDLINISAGASALPAEVERGVAEAIETAAEMGTVVVCAAGNEYATPADFPARHPATIGVGAFGQTGWGPPGSAVRDFVTGTVGGDGRWLGRNVFHWSDSAYGEGVDTVGPGIGILVARDGKPAFDLSGTSFSAPIVLGTLAVELSQDETYLSLPRDQARLEYVKGVLELYCRSAQMPAQLEGAGILELG